jgi:uncharacterized repeat protein (TIGR01451 family)
VLTDTATVTSTNNDPGTLDSTATIAVNTPDLSITKTADQPTINAGDTAAFTITVHNSGLGAAAGVVVTDPLPAGVVWTTSTPGVSIVGGTLTDTIGTLASAGSLVIHVSGVTTAANSGTLNNMATVASTNNVPATLNATAAITVNAPNLSITKTADQTVIDAGNTAAFTITVKNAGPGAAYNVVVTDALPPGVPWTTSTPDASIVGGVLTDNIGTLAAGASVVIHVSGVTPSTFSGTLTDTVVVSASNAPTPIEVASASITVNSCPPVTVTSLVRHGLHHQPTQFIVTFNGPLDPTTASDTANYHLSMLRLSGHSERIGIREATYDPVAHTVTLLPDRRLNVHHRYRLTISGVKDTCGDPIVGNGGPGGSFVVTFGIKSLGGIFFGSSAALPKPSSFSFPGRRMGPKRGLLLDPAPGESRVTHQHPSRAVSHLGILRSRTTRA